MVETTALICINRPIIPIPEVPHEPCLLLCPETLLLGLLIRKGAYRHMGIVSADQFYELKIPAVARELPLSPDNPDETLFDISTGTLNTWLKRLGELTGLKDPVTAYMFPSRGGRGIQSQWCESSHTLYCGRLMSASC